MKKWIVIDKRLILNNKFGPFIAVELNEKQLCVRLCEQCSTHYRNYIKYSVDEVRAAKQSGELLQERLDLYATTGIDII